MTLMGSHVAEQGLTAVARREGLVIFSVKMDKRRWWTIVRLHIPCVMILGEPTQNAKFHRKEPAFQIAWLDIDAFIRIVCYAVRPCLMTSWGCKDGSLKRT